MTQKHYYRKVRKPAKGRNGKRGKKGIIFLPSDLTGKKVKVVVMRQIKLKKNLHYCY